MKIIINVASIFKGGAEQVANSFINECRKFSEHEYHIFLCSNIEEQLDKSLFPVNFHFYLLKKRPGTSLIQLFKSLAYFNRLEKTIKPDVVISTGGHGYWKPSTAPLVTGFNIPHFIYPESPYFKKIGLRGKIRWFVKKKVHMYLYSRADALIGQTDDVRKRVEALLPGMSVYSVSNTVNGCFYEPEPFPDKLPPKKTDEYRLLTVSSYYPHKNLDIINEVAKELDRIGNKRVKFVLTLPEKKYERCIEPNNRSRVYNVGPIPISECPSLYDECDAMFLPTLLECFSASYAEAMVMKKPILTSNLGFAHTVCKDAALFFNPLNSTDIAEKITKLGNSAELQIKLAEKGQQLIEGLNTPESRTARFLEICNDLSRKSQSN